MAPVAACLARGGALAECAVRSFGPSQQLVKGLYAAFLPAWLAAYPRDQILAVRFEAYRQDPAAHLAKVHSFLGLPQPGGEELAAALGVEANRGHRKNSAVPG